jgi:hypothetical protein
VIAVSGGRDPNWPLGDVCVAFAMPQQKTAGGLNANRCVGKYRFGVSGQVVVAWEVDMLESFEPEYLTKCYMTGGRRTGRHTKYRAESKLKSRIGPLSSANVRAYVDRRILANLKGMQARYLGFDVASTQCW